MDKCEFSFWAQNLNNTDDDHAEVNGETLTDSKKCEDLTNRISQVTLNSKGKTIEKNGIKVTFYYLQSDFVLKVVWSQTDDMGRKAPVVCYGNVPSFSDNELKLFGDNFLESFRKFVNKRGRNSFSDEEWKILEQLTLNSFENIGKEQKELVRAGKHQKKSTLGVLGMGVGGTAALALIVKMPLIVASIPILAAAAYCQLTDRSKNNE